MACLNIHIFNVEHGDSILIEYIYNTIDKHYIIIDTNTIKKNHKKVCPVYEFLRKKSISKISALIITHFHKDHYDGVGQLLNKEEFKIQKIVIPPIFSVNNETIKNKQISKIKEKITNYIETGVHDEAAENLLDFTSLISQILSQRNIVEEVIGKEQKLRFPGVSSDLEGVIYLPIPRTRYLMHTILTKGNWEIDHFPEMNKMSIAMMLRYNGHNILFGGDTEFTEWNEHCRQMRRDNFLNLDADFIKSPHHGSKVSNSKGLYQYWAREKYKSLPIFISANGIRFPDKSLFENVTMLSLQPYCTNLSKYCTKERYVDMSNIPDEMRTFLTHHTIEKPIECMGDILLTIDDGGYHIITANNRRCIYSY